MARSRRQAGGDVALGMLQIVKETVIRYLQAMSGEPATKWK